VNTTRPTAGINARSIPVQSLSRIAANTSGSGSSHSALRYDASAAAPAGL
jgi:hypothetical protein